jgi:hypothetical protein
MAKTASIRISHEFGAGRLASRVKKQAANPASAPVESEKIAPGRVRPLVAKA